MVIDKDFHKWRWRGIAAWVILFTGLNVFGLYQLRNQANDGQESHKAICALVADYHKRIVDGEQFIKAHPNGIPGIPGSIILNSIQNEKRTAKILDRAVKCKN